MKTATVKQMKLIERMELLLSISFKGNTIEEASNFISANTERFRDAQELVFEMTYNENNY